MPSENPTYQLNFKTYADTLINLRADRPEDMDAALKNLNGMLMEEVIKTEQLLKAVGTVATTPPASQAAPPAQPPSAPAAALQQYQQAAQQAPQWAQNPNQPQQALAQAQTYTQVPSNVVQFPPQNAGPPPEWAGAPQGYQQPVAYSHPRDKVGRGGHPRPNTPGPTCQHGERFWNSFQAKSGKVMSQWLCPYDSGDYKRPAPGQCDAEWAN